MILKASQVSLGVWVEAFIQKLCDHISLNFQRTGGNIHHMIQTAEKVLLILRHVSDPRHIDGHNTHRSGTLP